MEQKSHCPYCGGLLTEKFMEGRTRLYCPGCQRAIYENPIPATCLVAIDESDRVLLVQRSVEPQKGEWCLPGGFIELGEPPEAGALRELAEETGLTGEITALLGVCTTPSSHYHSILMVGYRVGKVQGRLIPGDDASSVRWIPADHMPPIAFSSHRRFLNQVLRELGLPLIS